METEEVLLFSVLNSPTSGRPKEYLSYWVKLRSLSCGKNMSRFLVSMCKYFWSNPRQIKSKKAQLCR
ncbi:hypothetical protein NDU88_005310 [Pleurodeles waltl]|uniref:Uncharacterized protein n=1 Tax=Pleurodeles waltl TaxID=8319 RepID=A0AAV7TV60_PLEWA|nr:hypothetical protein NDU88_005310 [Pleurodeles waltl]